MQRADTTCSFKFFFFFFIFSPKSHSVGKTGINVISYSHAGTDVMSLCHDSLPNGTDSEHAACSLLSWQHTLERETTEFYRCQLLNGYVVCARVCLEIKSRAGGRSNCHKSDPPLGRRWILPELLVMWQIWIFFLSACASLFFCLHLDVCLLKPAPKVSPSQSVLSWRTSDTYGYNYVHQLDTQVRF